MTTPAKPTPEDRQRMAALFHFGEVRQVHLVVSHLRAIDEARRTVDPWAAFERKGSR